MTTKPTSVYFILACLCYFIPISLAGKLSHREVTVGESTQVGRTKTRDLAQVSEYQGFELNHVTVMSRDPM